MKDMIVLLFEFGVDFNAQDADGTIHVIRGLENYHPSVLGNGQPAAAAGEIVVGTGGNITSLNNKSGTFLHSPEVLVYVQESLRRLGYVVPDSALVPFSL